MSFGTIHPETVRQAVAAAALRGDKVPAIQRALAEGRLKGHTGPYQLPLETCRYYVKKAKTKAQASSVTKLASGDLSHAMDYLARQAFSEAELGLAEARAAKERDPDVVAKWVNLLKGIQTLVRTDTPNPGKPNNPSRKPVDPLTQRLTNPSP